PAAGAAEPLVEPDEGEIRRLLGSLPIARLREAGLLDGLLQLATPVTTPTSAPGTGATTSGEGTAPGLVDLDDLDVDALVRMASENLGS
ncbi:hypothetical protein J0670_37835, partial [Streptomyces sp. FH025]|nr:hypothetical protein [Streptomyces sp. FH025]